MIRETTFDDIEQVIALYNQAIEYFKENNINQWQNNYPNRQSLINDINNKVSFVLEQDNRITGSMACISKGDVDYNTIYEGAWLNDESYLTIHRIVVDNSVKNKGVAQQMMQEAYKYARNLNIYNIRIDTHQDNQAMLRFLKKEQFVFCGIVYINGISKRLAFQKKINNSQFNP